MQKHLLRYILSVCLLIFGALGMTSCIKSYTCRCEVVYSGKPGLPPPVVKEYSVKDTKKGATSKCQGASFTNTENGIITTETCDLNY